MSTPFLRNTPDPAPEHEEALLEYETEAEQPYDAGPVKVEVCEPVVTVPTVPQHATCYTVVVDTDDATGGVAELLPLDALRVRALVIVNDAPVVVCHSRPQAQSPANTAANVPNPSGAYIPETLTAPVELTGTQQMWVAATSNTAARVTVIAERRSA